MSPTSGKRRKPDAPTERRVGWVEANPLAAVSILGLLTYGLVRLAQGLFYQSLGTTPEEVGLTYARTLTYSLYGLVLLVGIYVVIYFLTGSC
jgi:hypothetical protein